MKRLYLIDRNVFDELTRHLPRATGDTSKARAIFRAESEAIRRGDEFLTDEEREAILAKGGS